MGEAGEGSGSGSLCPKLQKFQEPLERSPITASTANRLEKGKAGRFAGTEGFGL